MHETAGAQYGDSVVKLNELTTVHTLKHIYVRVPGIEPSYCKAAFCSKGLTKSRLSCQDCHVAS